MPLESTAESPLPVRDISAALRDWIGRLGMQWIEGQVTELTRRPGQRQCFLVLRDLQEQTSLRVVCAPSVVDAVSPRLAEGAHVVLLARPEFWTGSGSLQLRAREIRAVGLGELLAAVERLRATLAAEGVFAQERKRRLPMVPRVVGLVCGRASDAERDVVVNASARWPAVRFEIREVAVQGPAAVTEVSRALAELDLLPEVDVIVIARGGGSVEDLLPFSNEAMVRAVARCVTPVVSAIGHEADTPLLDLVADVRASTPTDAARRIVPDMTEEQRRLTDARIALRRRVTALVDRETTWLAETRRRPVLSAPYVLVDRHSDELASLRQRSGRAVEARVDRAGDDLDHLAARVVMLSPAATLARGYAVVRRADGSVVRDPRPLRGGEPLGVRVAEGSFDVTVA